MSIKYFAFCFFFVIVCNANAQDYRQHNQIFDFESNKYQHGTCKLKHHKKELTVNVKRMACSPIDTVVHLYVKDQNMMVSPETVVVKRCYVTGCYGQRSCVPQETKEVPIAVRFMNNIPNLGEKVHCGWVNVTEHTKCVCKCLNDKVKCQKENKMFNQNDCTCKCHDEDIRKTECHKKSNMVWDEDTCSCRCTKEIMECTTGSEWVPRLCACMQRMM